MAVAIFNLAATFAIFRTEVVSQDGEKPRGHVRAGLERVDIGQCAQQRLLHQIVGAVDIPAKGNGECAETGNRTENGFADRLVHRHHGASFFRSPSRRLTNSENRSGTPWLTTSS